MPKKQQRKPSFPFPELIPVPSHSNGFVPAPGWLKASRKKKRAVEVRDR